MSASSLSHDDDTWHAFMTRTHTWYASPLLRDTFTPSENSLDNTIRSHVYWATIR